MSAPVDPRLLLLLIDLEPLVWVAGSWARGTNHPDSDLDLVPRPNPDYDGGWDSRETLLPQVIEVLDRHGAAWDSEFMGQVYTHAFGETTEVYEGFCVEGINDTFPEDLVEPTTHEVMVHGVVMTALDEQWLAAEPWSFVVHEKRAKWEPRHCWVCGEVIEPPGQFCAVTGELCAPEPGVEVLR